MPVVQPVLGTVTNTYVYIHIHREGDSVADIHYIYDHSGKITANR